MLTTRSPVLYLLAVTLGSALGLATPASAQLTVDRFTERGDARARWIETTSPPAGAANPSVIELFVNGSSVTDFDDAAYVELTGFAGAPPARPPSYDFRASAGGRSGGSPRLIMSFSDGGTGQLRPLTLAAGAWTRLVGSGNWDSRGGSCGFRSQQTYAQLLACHPGAHVTGLGVWNDSGWLHPGGFNVLVDNIAYDGETITEPASGVLDAQAESPVLGRVVNVTPLAGEVLVEVPTDANPGFLELPARDDVPVGTLVDTRDGSVRLSTAVDRSGEVQTARFSEGVFEVRQSRAAAADGLTELVLRGGSFRNCRVSARRTATAAGPMARSAARRPRRRSRGRRSARSSAVTAWDTFDRCDGTLTVVRRGVVTVRDFDRRRSIVLRAGQRYLARAR